MWKIIKKIWHFFTDKNNTDCCMCIRGTSTGEWCWENCKGGDKFELDIEKMEKSV